MPRSVVAVQGCHAQNGTGDHAGPCPDQGKVVVVGGGGGEQLQKMQGHFWRSITEQKWLGGSSVMEKRVESQVKWVNKHNII